MSEFPWGLGYMAGPFRRVIDARYLQPILVIRPDLKRRNIRMFPLELRAVGDSTKLYRAEFAAPRDGELFLFSNDAMLPMVPAMGDDAFYTYSPFVGDGPKGNFGKAHVTVELLSHRTQ